MKVQWNQFKWNTPGIVWNGDVPDTNPNRKHHMIQIVLNLTNATDTEIQGKLSALAKAQTDHPTAATGLTTTSAQLAAAAKAIGDALDTQKTAEDAAKAATKDKDAAVEAGKQLIRDYGQEVLKGTGKDPAKINLLGYASRDTSAAPAPAPAGSQVPELSLKYGPNPGTLVAKCGPMQRLHSIEFEVNTTPNAAPTWQHWTSATSTPVTLTGLTSGALVQVRARGIFADGPGPWSDIAEHRVP